MGWAVLYIAFGVVALWLLGEVLLQYKARLRWRLLAFCGFLGVVIGVVVSSVVVIGIGAIAFAIGQTYVTMSFRKGFSTGWAIGGRPGASKRRKTETEGRQEPTLQVSGMEETGGYPSDAAFANAATTIGPVFDADAFAPGATGPNHPTEVYAPEPMPDDTGQYGVYGDPGPTPHGQGGPGGPDQGFGHDAHPGPGQDYGYDQGQQQYAAYADPYPTAAPTYGGAPHDPYAQPAPGQDPYGAGYQETPPGGVWVPQQRTTAADGSYGDDFPDAQPYPYPYPQSDDGQGVYDPGHDERQPYRY
ncbi:hypothetical protein ACFVW2_17525 [Streptomyces sp. NPDC058171]